MANHGQKQKTLLTIGALSKATQVPPETLRTWERRYGFPSPIRLDSGHRRYAPETIDHIKLINKALDAGYRPSNVLGLELHDLQQLVASPVEERAHSIIDRWMEHVGNLQRDQLLLGLEQQWFARGALGFIQQVLAPFVQRIGEQWYNGQLAVFHEQFATGVITEFLEKQWRPLTEKAAMAHKRALLCTLPGEYHAIGLHMVASILAVAGWQVDLIGTDLDPGTIANTALDKQPDAIMISVSSAANTTATQRQLRNLQGLMKRTNIAIITGGQGADFDIPGVNSVHNLEQLFEWAKQPR